MIIYLNEATNKPSDFFTTENPKVIPALLTFQEYLGKVNRSNQWHESHVYNYNIGDLGYYKGDGKLIKNFKVETITLKLYEFERKPQYAKWEGDNYVGSMSDEEMIEAGLSLYYYEYKVVHPENKNVVVGFAVDEWGALLISVVKEYQQMGIGEELVKAYRAKTPDKDSGGFTDAGYKQIQRYYTWMVNKFSSSGIYSDMVKKGEISIERAKEILNSRPIKNMREKNLIKRDSPNTIAKYYAKDEDKIYLIEDNWVIIFDGALKDINEIDKSNATDILYEKIIYAYVYIVDFNDYPQIYTVYGDEENISQAIYILSAMQQKYGGLGDYYLRNFEEKYKNIINKIYDNKNLYKLKTLKGEGYISNVDLRLITPKKPNIPMINNLKNYGKQWFKRNDEHDELKNRVMEIADSMD